MLFQMLNLIQQTADTPADSALEREAAGLCIALNTKEMRMVVADLNFEIDEAEARQLNLKHP
jgi:hypothetical protein